MNMLEGLRVIFSIVLVAAALFAALNANQGSLALPRPMRPRITFRRRAQMISLIVAGLAIAVQSAIVTQIPNPLEPASAVWSSNISVLITLFALLVSVAIHISGWWREGVIMRVPLDPDAEEKAKEAIKRARDIAHTSRTAMSLLSVVLDDLIDDESISSSKRKNIQKALDGVQNISIHIAKLHEEIRILQPDTEDTYVTKDSN